MHVARLVFLTTSASLKLRKPDAFFFGATYLAGFFVHLLPSSRIAIIGSRLMPPLFRFPFFGSNRCLIHRPIHSETQNVHPTVTTTEVRYHGAHL